MQSAQEILDALNIPFDKIMAVGNHDLKRHHVYRYESEGNAYIIKVYYIPRAQREAEAIEVARSTGMPVPEVLQWGTSPEGDEYLIMQCLPGRTVLSARIAPPRRPAIYHEMGRLLALLHTSRAFTPPDYAGQLITRANKLREEIAAQPIGMKDQRLADAALHVMVNAIVECDLTGVAFGMCHGDYDDRNVLCYRGKITGVIDFEHAKIGCLERDLAQIYRKTFLLHPSNAPLRSAFEAGYTGSRSMPEGFVERLPIYLFDHD